ncbi:type IV secretory system conjugative DNA transfer family protein [Stenotrophomonas sp. C3(2023)]|uniref:type IV secretory system conjugative DNA transfer family protein n=1 Tax=Stenotrophomonas sp. C3(2023) TaxID=3080277 RepID=UPI00293C9BD2|nr:type IV secretory system conjugative DNA transfer family protein [Stenotrophomonas sp. C3(2023)]MDV3468436.1 type IV secretory system conjugative DNA transfer family protein [Stenotrophomonas sp. C3(2023)]
MPGEGILIGRYKGHYLWLNGTQHVVMVAPTRSGKSSSVAVPVLLTYESSAVVLDVKGELHDLTSGYRARCGQTILVWAPYDEQARGQRFNPFTAMAGMPQGQRVAELQTIAAILYPERPGGDPFWVNQARTAFVAFASLMFENWDALRQRNPSLDPNESVAFPSLARLYLQTTGAGHGVRRYLQEVLEGAVAGAATRAALGSLVSLPDDTLASVIASVQVPLQQFLNPALAAATDATDIDVAALRRQRITLYVVVPPRKLDEAGGLLNLFFSSVIGANLEHDARSDASITHQVLMVMDEFTAMGRLDVWARRISVSASYGVRDLAIVQSQAQLRAVYGADDAQNFLTNHAASLVFTPREQEDAEAFSRAMGDCTVRHRQRTRSRGLSLRSRNTSVSDLEERRPLMLPQEIKALPRDEQLIFLEGCAPIRCRKNWYFKDRVLRRRLLPAVGLQQRPVPSSPPVAACLPTVLPRHDAEQTVQHDADWPRSAQTLERLRAERRLAVGMLRNGKVQPALPVLEQTHVGLAAGATGGELPHPTCRRALDRHHERALRRQCLVANEQTVQALGPTLTALAGRRARRSPAAAFGATSSRSEVALPLLPEEEPMIRLPAVAGAALAATLLGSCAAGVDGEADPVLAKSRYVRSLPSKPKHYPRNPNPTRRQLLTVRLHNPPGPLVVVGGHVQYEAPDCIYSTNRFAGATGHPVAFEDLEFAQLDATTWSASFYADLMVDMDYDGPRGIMNPCHWSPMHATVALSATGADDETIYSSSLDVDEGHEQRRKALSYFSRRIEYPTAASADHRLHIGSPDRARLLLPDEEVFAVILEARETIQ